MPLTSNVSVPIDRLEYYNDIEVIRYSIVPLYTGSIILLFLQEPHVKYLSSGNDCVWAFKKCHRIRLSLQIVRQPSVLACHAGHGRLC